MFAGGRDHQSPAQILANERKRKGIDETNPTYLRESLGIWVEDRDALVFKFSPTHGYYDSLPDGQMWEYVIGVDVGYDDADAIAVLAFNRHSPIVYLVHEDVKKKQGLDQLAAKVMAAREKYNPIAIVGDYGGGGKKLFESINQRHHINIRAAEKVRKFEYIELINDDLRTGKLLVPNGCLAAADWGKIQWHPNMQPGKPKIDDSFHSDIADAVLYAWREAKHYTYEPPLPKPTPGSSEFIQAQEDEMLQRAIDAHTKKKEDESWGEYVDPDDFDKYY